MGWETVRQISAVRCAVIYLTAYADDATPRNKPSPANSCQPFHNELRTTIELAPGTDRPPPQSLRWLVTTVRCMVDAMITTNRGGA
jgi:hypothetical protein